MRISELVVNYLKSKEFGCLITNPVYDDETEEYYFTYDGYIISVFVNVAVQEIDNELFVVISSVENNTCDSDLSKISDSEFLCSLISDVYYFKELKNNFPINLKSLLRDNERKQL